MKIVCAYSGGLDTSCMIPWLKEHYNAEIITYTGDLGQGDDLPAIREKALATGASVAVVDDLRERFVKEFIFPAIMAGAKYEGTYPLHTALGRPLLAQRLVEVAIEHGADAIAHGCTGKGNSVAKPSELAEVGSNENRSRTASEQRTEPMMKPNFRSRRAHPLFCGSSNP